MGPRRVLILVTDLEIGGTPTVVRDVATRLHEPRHIHVEVACLAPWGPVADQIRSAGLQVTALGARSPRDFPLTLHRLNRLIGSRLIDTVFSFLLHANATASASKLFLPDVRHVQAIQTTQPNPRWHWTAQRLAHHAADCVVVPSPSVADAARHRSGVPSEKIVVIPNAVDVAHYGDLPPRPPSPVPQVGFLGRFDPVKRIPDLLHALSLLTNDARLHLFGDGPDRPAIESTIDRLSLRARVTLHGRVGGPRDALRHLDLLVLPSRAEGLPMVLLEAMAARVPIVATDAPGIRDVIRHRHTGYLVPVGSPPSLADAIRTVLSSPDLRTTLIQNAHAEVTTRYSWHAVLPQYRRVLDLPG